MANYCENFLEITSNNEESVDLVLNSIKGDKEKDLIDFNKLIPYPTRFETLDTAAADYIEKNGHKDAPADGYNQGGYEWCIKEWGTKWNAFRAEIIEHDDEQVVISFQTAWAPPRPIIDLLAKKFPQYSFAFEYYEKGAAFCGSIYYESGEIKYECESEYYGFRGG